MWISFYVDQRVISYLLQANATMFFHKKLFVRIMYLEFIPIGLVNLTKKASTNQANVGKSGYQSFRHRHSDYHSQGKYACNFIQL